MTDNKLNSRQHRFVLNLFSGMSAQEAYEKAGYSTTQGNLNCSPYTLQNDPRIEKAIQDLRTKKEAVILVAETNNNLVTALTKAEKRTILAEIARARLVDFTQDGEPVLSGDTPNARAAREYYHRRRIDRDGNPVITKNIKLLDPIAAIAEDNKMTGDYAPSKHLVGHRVQFEIVHKRKHNYEEIEAPPYNEEGKE